MFFCKIYRCFLSILISVQNFYLVEKKDKKKLAKKMTYVFKTQNWLPTCYKQDKVSETTTIMKIQITSLSTFWHDLYFVLNCSPPVIMIWKGLVHRRTKHFEFSICLLRMDYFIQHFIYSPTICAYVYLRKYDIHK